MLYSEFVENVKAAQKYYGDKFELPLADFYSNVIEPIYMYHPGSFNKPEIATLYCIGGKPLMRELLNTAIDYRDLENEIDRLKCELEEARQDLEHAKESYYK